MSEVWTVRRAVLWTADFLGRKGADSPRTDADLLLADALGVDRVRLLIDFDKPLKPEELAAYRERIARRAAGESLAYILGRKEFYGRDFAVDSRVLVPRPETEGLVEIGLQALDAIGRVSDGTHAESSRAPAASPPPSAESGADGANAASPLPSTGSEGGTNAESPRTPAASPLPPVGRGAGGEGPFPSSIADSDGGDDSSYATGQETDGADNDAEWLRVKARRAPTWDGSGARALDLCAGSGCIGITLALERPGLQVDLVELEPGAAEVARSNVHKHGVEARCQVFVGDLFAALEGREGPYQLILSNPPYVPSAEIDELAEEVKREPRLALDGGDDGLDVVRRIVSGALERLAPGGTLAMELSLGQPAVVADLLREAGFREARVEADFTRRDRYVVATR